MTQSFTLMSAAEKKKAAAKEKRQRQKELAAQLQERRQRVTNANARVDDMALLASGFRTYDAKGLSLVVSGCRAGDIAKAEMDVIVELTRHNMQELYEASTWGWDARKKRDELCDDDARYVLARDASTNALVAFVHYRFMMDSDDDQAVVYCYEVQVDSAVQKKGVGRYLMKLTEMIGFFAHMALIRLTVFIANSAARQFYRSLKYSVDDISPESVECDFEILSKSYKRRQKDDNE